ncbi:hypothetical protein CPB83DRAFT_943415 [Crepidotus variabilis]|uniref:Uncharacterized protein n=1 Tax=Crepidotus variabilis TaxID=179855 RepID=A0A9P6EAS5_9AGAR|nr:hypothetical protein CPB83DRAFT_921922 [Crepidotus variabilis]KAF9525552.1 hypothetical protein CPB83DRAFT_943415 [Crepidotus variabilis]
MRQDQDSINVRNHANLMFLLGMDLDHPFEYARVLGIFHVDVGVFREGNEMPLRKEVLWVRRYRRDRSYRAGFARKRLHRLSFIPDPQTPMRLDFSILTMSSVQPGSHSNIPIWHNNGFSERRISRSC